MNTLLKLSFIAALGVIVSTVIATQTSAQANAAWTSAGSVNIQVSSTGSATASLSLCKTQYPKQGYKVKARTVITNTYGATGQVKAMTTGDAGVAYGNVVTAGVGQTSITGYGPNIVQQGSSVTPGFKSHTASWVNYGTSKTVSSLAFCS